MTSRASRRKSSWSSVNADCTSAPSGDGLAFLATARGRQARTQGGSIWVYIGPTEDAAWRARAPPEAHCLLPGGALVSMRISFQQQLDRTETALQEEGEFVLRALRGSMNALWEQDTELSDEVIAFDDQIDAIYFNIQGGIQSLLAQQTPDRKGQRL